MVDLTPVDGLHIEVQIIHEMSTSVKDFHEGFKEYGEKHGILKNNSVNANLEFINIEKVGWDDYFRVANGIMHMLALSGTKIAIFFIT